MHIAFQRAYLENKPKHTNEELPSPDIVKDPVSDNVYTIIMLLLGAGAKVELSAADIPEDAKQQSTNYFNQVTESST